MSTWKKYGEVSGYKLNLTKSELFPINKTAQSLLYSHFPFKITNSVKYFGVVVTRGINGLFLNHYFSALFVKLRGGPISPSLWQVESIQ